MCVCVCVCVCVVFSLSLKIAIIIIDTPFGSGYGPVDKLQAVMYDILPPTTAIIDYAAVLEKLSANGQLFTGVQMAISV